MNQRDIVRRRLASQHLLGRSLASAPEVVASLGAVQAQDYAGAKWAVAQRTTGLTDAHLDAALADGSIIRTHILRPTWHFVTPADIRWMLDLTAPRVGKSMAHVCRTLGLDDALFRKSNAVLARALAGGGQLTRGELGAALARAKIVPEGDERTAHIMMRAELDAVVCSGPRRGRQFTYALFDARVPPAKALPRDEALAMLAVRYFSGHGPATAKDFAWWSGLTLTDARRALPAAGGGLCHEALGGVEYWWGSQAPAKSGRARDAQLLPAYDEYTVAYADRAPILAGAGALAGRLSRDVIFVNTVIVGGQVLGEWQRTISARGVAVTVRLLAPVTQADRKGLLAAAARYAEFLGLALDVTIV